MASPTATAKYDAEARAANDADRDSLHILPLSMIPLETRSLRHARLIKNGQLQTVVELFRDGQTGSGQLDIGKLGKVFNWPENPRHPDELLLWKLAPMPSFDVYSLRVLFREAGIATAENSALRLSAGKTQELTAYMTSFTRPLVNEIYGTAAMEIGSFDDLLGLFRNPDVRKVQERLQTMSVKLGIGVADIPRFLEDYADIFLSLSYYRQCLDSIVPSVDDFLESIKEFDKYMQLRNDEKLMRACKTIESKLNESLAAITGRFESFERSTKDMWSNLSAERFRMLEKHIKSYHTTIGGVLCALNVKMNAWNSAFPVKKVGSPSRRAEFVMTEMIQGIERIQKIDISTHTLSPA